MRVGAQEIFNLMDRVLNLDERIKQHDNLDIKEKKIKKQLKIDLFRLCVELLISIESTLIPKNGSQNGCPNKKHESEKH